MQTKSGWMQEWAWITYLLTIDGKRFYWGEHVKARRENWQRWFLKFNCFKPSLNNELWIILVWKINLKNEIETIQSNPQLHKHNDNFGAPYRNTWPNKNAHLVTNQPNNNTKTIFMTMVLANVCLDRTTSFSTAWLHLKRSTRNFKFG